MNLGSLLFHHLSDILGTFKAMFWSFDVAAQDATARVFGGLSVAVRGRLQKMKNRPYVIFVV